MRPIRRSLLCESLQFPAGTPAGTTIYFPEIAELNARQGVVVTGIEAYTDTDLAAGPSNDPNITAADSLNVLVSLWELSTQRIKNIPYTSLVATSNSGIYKEFDPFALNVQKSGFLTTAALAAGVAFRCNVSIFYYRLTEREMAAFLRQQR